MTNRTSWTFFSTLLSLLLLSATATAKKRGDEEAVQFLDQVRESIDIRAAGSPPFILHARVEAAPLERGGPSAVGSLVLTWLSPLQWREDIGFPGFTQMRIAGQGKLWTTRSVGFEPVRVNQLDGLMDLRSQWTLRPKELVTGPKVRKRSGVSMKCVEIRGSMEAGRELCAHADTLLPLRTAPLSSTQPAAASYEYADYIRWGSSQFPRVMRVYEGSNLVVDAHAELSSAPEMDPSRFLPQAQATEWDWCDNAQPPRLLSTVAPQYPDAERRNQQVGMVSVYVVVGTDGSLHNPAVARSAGRNFDTATLASVRQWRYQPAMCGSIPVPTETIIDVRYTLSY
jgi:TonB family protein